MTTISIICVGDELLDGRVRERNAAFFGGWLDERGLSLREVRIVADQQEAIVDALDDAADGLVVVSGGLGPTSDDRTREAAAAWCGSELREDASTLARMKRRFEERDYPFTDNNRRQGFFPGGATILATEVGSAAGFRVSVGDKTAFFFPGVPGEFRWFVRQYVGPTIERRRSHHTASLKFHGLGESLLETRLQGLEGVASESGVSVGFRAAYPVIEVKLSATSSNSLAGVKDFVRSRVGAWLVAEDDEPLPARVGRLLVERGATVTTAESCTAGSISAELTEVSGSSSWFERGFVTYSNAAKSEELGVDADILERCGAVSPQTVAQMAVGARRRAGAEFALAVSGIAGPTGGTPEKPVGTVHFGLATESGTFHRHVHFRLGSRRRIRQGTVYSALALLLWYLEDRLDEHDVAGPYSDETVFSRSGISVPTT